jgi:hypothetical protein
MKFGRYVIKATDTDTLDIFISTDIHFDRGTDVDYTSDLLKVESVDISGATTSVASLGIEFTNNGTVSFVAGDTAEFWVYPPYSRKLEVVIGAPSDSSPEFGALLVGQKRGDGELTCVDVFKVKANGLPIGFEAQSFSESEVKADCLYDSSKGGVFKFISLKASS